MRRTLTALVLLSATLFIWQSLPGSETAVVTPTSSDGTIVEEWVQTRVADFEQGELECVALSAVDDGEVVLAEVQEGQYCASGTFISRVRETSVVFNVVGPAWSVEKPMGTAFQIEVRVSRDGETWTSWLQISPDEDGPEAEEMTYGNLVVVAPARHLQYRLTLGTFESVASPMVREIVLTVMNSREGPTTEEARAMILPQDVTSGVPQPRIISRRGWGANESWATREPVYRKPVAFVIHHTVTPNKPEDPVAIVRAILRYHAVSREWGDIGYNFLIDHQGNIYEGRKGGDGVVGVHAGRYNYGSIGIALMGDYRSAQMTPAMKEALVSLMAWEADRFGIHPLESSYFITRDFPHILGHRDLYSTVCPGDQVYRLLPQLRQLTWQRLLAHNPRIAIDSPEAGEAVSGEVEIQVSSPSPTTARTQLLLDGSMQVEGESSVAWTWNTRQFSEGPHGIEAVATSIQGRTSRAVHEVIVDNTPPSGSMLINDGACYTSQLTVTLGLRAEDGEGKVAGMQLTQDDASEFSELEEFVSTKQWVLCPGEGQKTIGVRFLDWAGNASPVYTTSVFLDSEPPGDWSLLEMGESGRVVLEVSDHGSGLDPSSAAYSVSIDGGITWGEWCPASCDAGGAEAPLVTCRLLAESVSGATRFKIMDTAGNEGYSPIYDEAGAPTPPETPTATAQPTRRPTESPTAEVRPGMLPDLVVDSILFAPEIGLDSGPMTVTVVIRNDSGVDVQDGFWVELSVDPPDVPRINSVAGQDGQAAFWYVPGLGAHETLSLALEDADNRYSTFEGRLSAGRHEIYAYVDAYNSEGEVGLVSEVDETNNLLGPLIVERERASDENRSDSVRPLPGEILRLLVQRLERFLAQLREHVGSRRS